MALIPFVPAELLRKDNKHRFVIKHCGRQRSNKVYLVVVGNQVEHKIRAGSWWESDQSCCTLFEKLNWKETVRTKSLLLINKTEQKNNNKEDILPWVVPWWSNWVKPGRIEGGDGKMTEECHFWRQVSFFFSVQCWISISRFSFRTLSTLRK